MAKIININTGKEVIPDRVPEMICTVCSSPFDMQSEGGTCGYFGLIPVQFCPYCFSSMMDMAKHYIEEGDEDEEGN
jgi:hypothetical protein